MQILKNLNKRAVLLLLLLVVYNFFFWHEKLGINLAIFSFLFAASVPAIESFKSFTRNQLLALAPIIYSCALVTMNNSVFSKFSVFVSFMVYVGYVHQKEVKSVLSAALTSLFSFMLFPFNIIEAIRVSGNKHKTLRKVYKVAKLVVLPLSIFWVFYGLYAYSSPLFNSYSVSFWDRVSSFFGNFFDYYPFARFAFLFLGLLIIMGALFNNNISVFARIDSFFFDRILRDSLNKLMFASTRSKYIPYIRRMNIFNMKMNSLKTEYKIGLILLVMVNALILILNVLDVRFLWLGFDSSQVENLAYYVHDGTYTLIFSIVLSMMILLYYFRGNLNFYGKNKLFKSLAYFWIFQNGIMAVSVALRNIYYIQYYYALSYKRIGVMVFLFLVFIGLVTMLLKIKQLRTTYNIFKMNCMAAFVVMLLVSSVSWDVNIARFNLMNPDKKAIDVQYLFTLSDDVLPVLYENKEVLEKAIVIDVYDGRATTDAMLVFKERLHEFFDEQKEYTWLSWNLTDENTANYLKQIKY